MFYWSHKINCRKNIMYNSCAKCIFQPDKMDSLDKPRAPNMGKVSFFSLDAQQRVQNGSLSHEIQRERKTPQINNDNLTYKMYPTITFRTRREFIMMTVLIHEAQSLTTIFKSLEKVTFHKINQSLVTFKIILTTILIL